MSYLRKGGEPRPIALTSQEIAITMWCVALLFACVFVVMLPRQVLDQGVIWYCYDIWTLGFVLFMILFFSFFGIIWMCFSHSKFALNLWTDRIHPDWHAVLRADKNGLVTGQIMKKDSLGFIKGIVFGKKAGLINKGGFRLTLPNGNPVLIVLDFMSHNADLAEAIGWTLYKKKHGFIGYNAYVQCKKEKKTLLTYEPSDDTQEPEVKQTSSQGPISKPQILTEKPKENKKSFFKRRKKYVQQ